MMRRKSVLAAPLLTALLIAWNGCSDEDSVTPPPPDTRPTSAAELMHRFVAACESRDAAAYEALVDTGFVFHVTQATVFAYDLPRGFFDRAEDLAITGRMFSGEAYTPAGGSTVPAISGITFNLVEQEAGWQVALPGERLPGTLHAPFRVDIAVDQGIQHHVSIKGIIEFHVQAIEAGADDTRYLLAGQVDDTSPPMGGKRATQDVSWGSLKAAYR